MTTLVTHLNAQDKERTDKHFWHTMETKASPQAIWKIWTDVPNWKDWDTGLKDASIKGDFVLGSKGTIISLEDRKSKFKVVKYTEGQSYTYKTKLPLGSLYVKRYLTEQNGITTFTHEVWFSGLTGGIFARSFGSTFREMLPDVLNNIKKIAESK
ncbi:MAG: SRPBCC family protein [Bacteroidota bacterium]